ncbi:MAG: hypothetical protein DPW18_01805 [Chloroflexi bacterium]|nr:hypothetical protein [Chloroflexota bacterium]MDL1944482.1 hypothetical protein [Chloroflexi bacterium CFX2]
MSPETPAETNPAKKSLSEFKAEAYANIPQMELVLLAVLLLQNDDLPATTEEIVSICFRLFPQSFALKNYFYWPDSALAARRLQDAKERGLLKGTSAEGYALKVKGKQTARRAAKALGIELPKPKKIEAPQPVKVEAEPVKEEAAPARAEPQPKTPAAEKKKVKRAAPVKKQVKKSARKKEARKEAAPVIRKKVKPKPVEVKKTVRPAAKPKPKRKAKVTAPARKAVVHKKPTSGGKRAANVSSQKVRSEKPKTVKPQKAQPTQLTLALPVKEKAAGSAGSSKSGREAKPAKQTAAPVPQVQFSKEEKDKAGKIVKLMERSDAYLQYKKNGGKARISEFDFRNMLYATMESSAETLKRNVDLFKRYAGIHNRMDLIAFLTFCEESFAPLLNAKQPARKLKF